MSGATTAAAAAIAIVTLGRGADRVSLAGISAEQAEIALLSRHVWVFATGHVTNATRTAPQVIRDWAAIYVCKKATETSIGVYVARRALNALLK